MPIPPMLIAGGMSLLGSLLGGGNRMPAGQRNLLNLQHRAARETGEYARGVPGSDPQELAAMASMRGLLGAQQRQAQGNLFGNLGAAGAVNPGSMMRDLAVQFGGQQQSAMGGLFGNFLQNRRNALMQSAQMAANALPASQQTQQGPDFGGIGAALGQALAYQQMMKRGAPLQQATPGTVTAGMGGGAGYWAQTPYGSQQWKQGPPPAPSGAFRMF